MSLINFQKILWGILVIRALAGYPSTLGSFMGSLDSFLEQERSKEVFHGLHFTKDPKQVSCQHAALSDKMLCRIASSNNVLSLKTLAEIQLVKVATSSKAAIPLLRLKRKNEWIRQHSPLNQYVEQPIKVGAFAAVMQGAQYYRLNNSFCPVLLRAVDVVINDLTSISITISADVNDWPLVEKELEAIMQSFRH